MLSFVFIVQHIMGKVLSLCWKYLHAWAGKAVHAVIDGCNFYVGELKTVINLDAIKSKQ